MPHPSPCDPARVFRFGAVYFRGQDGPPSEDWERDHRVAAEDGHTLLRHWVPWNVVEIDDGEFRLEDYDSLLELAERHGIRVVLAEMLVDFPEWLIARYPEARIETPSGGKRQSEMHVSSVNGGHRALCLNQEPVREAARRFLTTLAARYAAHPALFGFDIWNECTEYTAERLCFCGACQRAFRDFARAKYGDIRAVGEAWRRPSLTAFEQIELPRTPGLFPDFLDSIRFRNDDAQEQMRFRRIVLEAAAPSVRIVAHGNARTHADASVCVGDDFRAAENADVFGYTHYFGTRQSALLSGDIIRGAARGKEFWRAEAVGGSQWCNRRLGHPAPEMDELDDPAKIRFDALVSMACGALAYQNPRWRSLLVGPLFSAYGWYADDGSRTERSEVIRELTGWASRPEVKPVWSLEPVAADVAIVLVDEAQDFCYALNRDTAAYAGCVRGLHRGLTAAGLSVDVVKPDAVALREHHVAYVPYPVALSDATIATLLAWVEAGGHLIVEGAAGYFDERARVSPRQPSRALSAAIGAVVTKTSFALDRHDGLAMSMGGTHLPCALYRQSFAPTTAEPIGHYADGSVAALRSRCGAGTLTALGSMPSYAMLTRDEGSAWLRSLVVDSGHGPLLRIEPSVTIGRAFAGLGGHALWLLNPSQQPVVARVQWHDRLDMSGEPRALRGELVGDNTRARSAQVKIAAEDAALLLFA
jgi:beta-galactosidase